MDRELHVFVEFARELDPHGWRRRHAQGLVPDATPYGLHLLEDFGCHVQFRNSRMSPGVSDLSRLARRSAAGLDIVPAVLAARDPARRFADVVLCMDEDAGIPSALSPCGPPVVSGVAWLENVRELSMAHRVVARAALGRMAGMFTQCSAMVEPLTTGFGVPADKVHTVRLGIDADHFTPAPWPTGTPMVFSVGDDRMRDHTTLVTAMNAAHAQVPMRFELATTLPVNVDPSFSLVHRRRMDDAVRGCYARASIVAVALHPTRQGSGLTVILETMASGRPLVVTDNPGLSDYVRHGETGLLVPAGDAPAMARAVESLLRDPARARAMGERGRAVVEEMFTSRHMAEDLRGVLDAALVPRRRAHGPHRVERGGRWEAARGTLRPLRRLTRPGTTQSS
ncbi:MAG: glycosyltransferase family 4 protein [Dermatophilus congolensis]|nr:glycosyltransferase family 4 protein [Dermatophilus congolensis]